MDRQDNNKIVPLFTPVEIFNYSWRIQYTDAIFFLGSCFAEYIGEKFLSYLFRTYINPFGTVFNPASVASQLSMLIEKKILNIDDLDFFDGMWFSFDHYTAFSSPDKEICLRKINKAMQEASAFLDSSAYIFITLGTARVYRHKEKNRIVSNCHKLPAEYFVQELLTVEQITEILKNIFLRIDKIKRKKIILTISPIRHWKDGAHGNQISKASLLLAVHRLVSDLDFVFYFPAYEIVMDELRDYRYYEHDMIHINRTTIDYMWAKAMYSFFSRDTMEIMKEIYSLRLARNHNIKNIDSPKSQHFIHDTLQTIEKLKQKYPYIDFSDDYAYFSDLSRH